jgi:hypothetical protein
MKVTSALIHIVLLSDALSCWELFSRERATKVIFNLTD